MKITIFLIITQQLYCEEPKSKSKKEIWDQKRKIEFNMTKLRVKLLKENEELRKLNDRIIKQQKQLAKKLDAQPEMRLLINKLETIKEQLKTVHGENSK